MLTPTTRKVKGISGNSSDLGRVMQGTIQWDLEDDDGVTHCILLPNSYYVPGATSKLLSPQHWAQMAKDNRPLPRGTWCATHHDVIILEWGQRRYRRMIRLDPGSANVGMYAPHLVTSVRSSSLMLRRYWMSSKIPMFERTKILCQMTRVRMVPRTITSMMSRHRSD